MGLNIVKGIVDMYNGRIEVSSDAQKGVRMLVELPR
jgi:signal transduction histidine kinase